MEGHRELRPELESGCAFITGAGSGIGAALAVRLAARGMDVVGFDRDPDGLAATRRHVDDRVAGTFTSIPGDVTSEEDLERAAASIETEVSIVVANAGIALGGRFEDVPIAEWRRLFEVNVLGTVRTFDAFLSRLRAQQKGWLVCMSSSAGLFPDDPFAGPYAASKSALIGLSRSLALQVRGDGLGVSVICPRLTDTPFPRSATAWTPNGPVSTSGADVSGADTVEALLDIALEDLERGRFLSTTAPDAVGRMKLFAESPDAYLQRVLDGAMPR